MNANKRLETHIEERIAALPKGSITRKVIQGKDRYYLQWREGEKVKSRYVKESELPELSAQIAQRKELQQRLLELQVNSIRQSLAGARVSVAADVDAHSAALDSMVNFFLSLDRGFCLEARDKKLPLDGADLRVDWVFYNRILHCHLLVNLKNGAFRKSCLDQLGTCVRYYRDRVMGPGDNPPAGLLLSTRRGPKMVEYVPSVVKGDFAAVYKPRLPSQSQLLDFLEKSDLLEGDGV